MADNDTEEPAFDGFCAAYEGLFEQYMDIKAASPSLTKAKIALNIGLTIFDEHFEKFEPDSLTFEEAYGVNEMLAHILEIAHEFGMKSRCDECEDELEENKMDIIHRMALDYLETLPEEDAIPEPAL